MSATTTFINSILEAAFKGQTYTGGVIKMKLFTGALPSAGGVEVTGGGYAPQTLAFAAAASKVIAASPSPTFTDLPTVTIVAIGIYSGTTLIDEFLLNPAFTPSVTNNALTHSYSFNLNA